MLLGFVGKGFENPVVLGTVWSAKRPPPKHSTEKVRGSKVYQTRKHRMEFIDEEGKESITISTAKGQLRV